MPSCQSRVERQKGRLNADKSALETWSSAPLVVKQVFAFFLSTPDYVRSGSNIIKGPAAASFRQSQMFILLKNFEC